MKINLVIFFIIGISLPTYSYASPECFIKDKTPDFLNDYIKDNRQVVKNITDAIIKHKTGLNEQKIKENKAAKSKIDKELLKSKRSFEKTGNDIINAGNETISIFNEIFNFSRYFSYFNYFVTYPIFNEVSFQVKRDYTLIDNENKGLVELIKKLDQNGESFISVKNPCKGITNGMEKCTNNFKNKTTKYILGKLIQNNDNILDYYRNLVTGGDIKEYTFILVSEKFIQEMTKNYGEKSVLKCNEEKDGFFLTIKKAIQDISLINETSEKGIQKWKDTFDLLIGNKPDEESKLEQAKLKEYLSDNGVASEKQDILMSNLEKYNEEKGFSLNNNFITNTFQSTKKKIQKDLENWKKENIGNAIPKDVKKVSINKINIIKENSDKSKEIQRKISELYQNEIPFAAVGDITTDTLRAKIINSHMNIQDSINTLEKACIVSVNVCKQQGGGGNCGSCN